MPNVDHDDLNGLNRPEFDWVIRETTEDIRIYRILLRRLDRISDMLNLIQDVKPVRYNRHRTQRMIEIMDHVLLSLHCDIFWTLFPYIGTVYQPITPPPSPYAGRNLE